MRYVSHSTRVGPPPARARDRKSTRLNSSHGQISYAVFCLKKNRGSRDRNECGGRRCDDRESYQLAHDPSSFRLVVEHLAMIFPPYIQQIQSRYGPVDARVPPRRTTGGGLRWQSDLARRPEAAGDARDSAPTREPSRLRRPFFFLTIPGPPYVHPLPTRTATHL